jgi:hypothetical protein
MTPKELANKLDEYLDKLDNNPEEDLEYSIEDVLDDENINFFKKALDRTDIKIVNVGSSGGETQFVIKIGDQHFGYDGYYSSYGGTEWQYDGDWYECQPTQVTYTEYHKKKS